MRISIGGSIGSGKSTILQMLKANGYDVFFEPVDEWKHISKFYEDKKRWAFTFQIEVLNSFTSCPNKKTTICERSPWESYHIFAKTLLTSGDMTVDEFELYKNLYDKFAWKPDLFIYLRTDPSICMERIKLRNRLCEASIDLEYLKTLHTLYDSIYLRNAVCINANNHEDNVFNDVLNAITTFSQL